MKSSKLIAIFLLMALMLSACGTPSEDNIAVISTEGTVVEYEINLSSSDPIPTIRTSGSSGGVITSMTAEKNAAHPISGKK